MNILFEVLKWLFFFVTIIVSLFFLRWDVVLSEQYFFVVKQILIPWYLLLCWNMFGYIIANIRSWNDSENQQRKKIYTKSFIIWIVIWTVLACSYIFI